MRDSNRVMREADAVLQRHSERSRSLSARARARRRADWGRRFKRVILACVGVIVAAMAIGLVVGPIGFEGVLFTLLALVLAVIFFAGFPLREEVRTESLVEADIKALPMQTERWLEKQRPALPAPAMRLVDDIGVQLEALAPQLEHLDPREPAAAAVRRLVAEELPELVSGYQRVPEPLRREERHGISPDRQLVEGLTLVESELARMTEQLASGNLDKLATQGRYLELKYRGDDEINPG